MGAFFAIVSEDPMKTVGTKNINNNIPLHCNSGNHPPFNRVIPSRRHFRNGQTGITLLASLHPATGSLASHATSRIAAATTICRAGAHKGKTDFSRPGKDFLIPWPRGAP
jgi:hypothetical protein